MYLSLKLYFQEKLHWGSEEILWTCCWAWDGCTNCVLEVHPSWDEENAREEDVEVSEESCKPGDGHPGGKGWR